MQRSSTYKKFVKSLFWFLLYVGYLALTTIYLFLPPLMALLFFLFRNALKERDTITFLFVLLSIVFLEAQKGFFLFTVVIYFLIMYRLIEPKIEQSINERNLKNFLLVGSVYIGYMLFYMLLSKVFLVPSLSVDSYIVYYIIVEFFLVSIFL